MKFSRFFCYIAAIFMVFSFSACSAQNEEILGIYTCARLELDGEDFYVLDVYPNGCVLQLSKWGQAWLDIDENRFYGRWELEEDNFILDINGEISQGKLKDGVCILSLAENGMEHSFLREGANLPEKSASVQLQSYLTPQQEFWNGDWYGHWSISNAQGRWQDHSGQRFDCFARFDVDEQGEGKMIFWDEIQDSYHPIAVAEISVVQEKNAPNTGIVLTTGGNFLDAEFQPRQWRADPEAFPFDSIFYVENAHYEGEDGAFDYTIILRPWGRTWEDVEASEPDMLPFFYHDWYLPYLSAGSSMPDSFEYAQETIIRNTWVEDKQEQQG